ncbi:rhodanese-like domain-containing protein [Tropicimonas sp. IMCC34011]|uniref:rhodanese-like domain-containing protein n=1 Tax=Tropicimonas sp. IMCC34011 TaxID=2248759 RepID=UPI000E267AC6|nr:rhodanese-like domain-containing protein [Tropicimonas sp. IMCC34011]
MKTEETDGGTLETWTPDEVGAALEAGEIVLIDVRTPQEYALERIPGALLFPMSHFDAGALPTQDGKRIVFHCAGGARSEKVARAALAAGLDPVAHLGGGFGVWKGNKRPYLGTDMATGAPKLMNG